MFGLGKLGTLGQIAGKFTSAGYEPGGSLLLESGDKLLLESGDLLLLE